MQEKGFTTKKIARAGIIASLYIATSFVTAPIASGAIQIRLSEALTLLALIFPETVPALFVGCGLTNLITGCAPYDIIFGSLITLFASVLTLITRWETVPIPSWPALKTAFASWDGRSRIGKRYGVR